MKKRIISILLAFCMVLTLLPANAQAGVVYVARNLSTGEGYTTLQAAVDVVTGGAIQLLRDATENITIPSGNDKSFTIDLNGKTLNGGTSIAISHNGSGILTITDSSTGGKVSNSNFPDGTIALNGGSLVVDGGTVENTRTSMNIVIQNNGVGSVTVLSGAVLGGTTGVAINNISNGNVNISGGIVNGEFRAIGNLGAGSVNITGGSVSTNGIGIYNDGSGSVNISNGTVSSTADMAIYNDEAGPITISGTATITSANGAANSGTIKLYGNYPNILTITGGTISNSNSAGNAIYCYHTTLRNISIPSGTAIIKGGGMAINNAPNLSSYTNVKVTASTNYDGSSPEVAYNPAQISTYKYLTFAEITNTTVNTLDLTDNLTAPAINDTPATSFATDLQFTGTVSWNGSPMKFLGNTAYTATVTLTAAPGYTFSGVAQNAFTYTGATVTNPTGSGNTMTVTIVFPATAAKVLQSIIITAPPAKTAYKFGETFSSTGMVVKATYNDGTEDENFTSYTVDKTSALTMSDTSVTLTATAGSGITTTQAITINKADGPTVTGVAAMGCTNISNNDGKLTGVTAAMEYKKSEAANYTPGTGSDITGLTNGTYLVRVKATATHSAGADSTFIVAAFIPAPTYTISGIITGSDTNSGISGASVQLKSGSSNMGSTILTASNGAYTISGVPAGTYSIEVSASSYDRGTVSSFEVSNTNITGKNLTLTKTVTVGGYEPSPILTPAPDKTNKSEGRIEKDQERSNNAPSVSVNNSSDELKSSVLTPKEREMVESGENAKVILKVSDISTSVSDEEKKLIKGQLSLENGDADSSVMYVDLSLYKQIGNQQEKRVTETSGKIHISLEVPERFWNTDVSKNRAFYVVRVHNGEVTRLDGSYDPEKHLFTFETDRFSTYALSYQDSSIQTYQDFYHLQLTVKLNETSQILSYKRIADAEGYLIYGGKCGEKMTELVKVPADITSYTVTNLKQGTYYKYQVKAYQIIDGKQVIIMTSKVVHSIFKGKTYADPTKVILNVTSVKLVTGESETVTCQVVLPRGKKLKGHTAVVRYEASDKAVVAVDSTGKITAKAKGSCYVYAYAQNGVYQKIKVTVK